MKTSLVHATWNGRGLSAMQLRQRHIVVGDSKMRHTLVMSLASKELDLHFEVEHQIVAARSTMLQKLARLPALHDPPMRFVDFHRDPTTVQHGVL